MMKPILHRNKKGVSEMVSYVLLVVIAVGLSGLVFSYLRVYVPKDKFSCDEDVQLIIQEKNCYSEETNTNPNICEGKGYLEINLQNKGLFNVDYAIVRVKEPNRITPALDNQDTKKFGAVEGEEESTLSPNEVQSKIVCETNKYNFKNNILYTIEVQPGLIGGKSGREEANCNSIVTTTVTCS